MRHLIIISIILLSINLNAQTILKGKALSEKLMEIDNLLSEKQFEKAISTFYNEKEVISYEKVKKKDITLYHKINDKIAEKKSEFRISSSELDYWQKLLTLKQYETLHKQFVFKISKDKFTESNYEKYSSLSDFLKKWFETYLTCMYKYVEQPNKTVISKNKPNDYFSATEALKIAKNTLLIYDKIKEPEGEIPLLQEQIKGTKQSIINHIAYLEKYMQDNKPLTTTQINKLLNSSNITMNQLEKHAIFVEKDYSNIFVHLKIDGSIKKIKLYELADLMSLDVIRYNKLWNKYDSELKKKAFSQTAEYKRLLDEMKIIYDKVKDMYFYMPIKFSCYSNKYDLNKKSFRFFTSELEGYQYGKNTNYIQFKTLCLTKPNNVRLNESVIFGGTNYLFEQYYYVPVNNETIALKLEEKCKSSSLVFVFKIRDIERKKTVLFRENFIKARTTRVLLIDNRSDKIYLQYKY